MLRCALVCLLLSAPAWAGDALSLKLKDGKTVAAQPVSCNDQGLLVRVAGKEQRIAWDRLQPESAFAARKSLTPYDDGAARLALSEFAASLDLYPEAISQLEVALALGAVTEKQFEKRSTDLKTAEIAYLGTRIDDVMEKGDDPAAALAAIKRLKERYPSAAATKFYSQYVPTLLKQISEKAAGAGGSGKSAPDDAALAKLRSAVHKLFVKKDAAVKKADGLLKEGHEAFDKGQVGRVRKRLVETFGAQRYYKEARTILRKIARLDVRFQVTKKADLQKQYDALEKKLVECYLVVARMDMSQRDYKEAAEYVRKILLYDPVNEEALDMVKIIRKNRITFKLSTLTNTHPIVTGG